MRSSGFACLDCRSTALALEAVVHTRSRTRQLSTRIGSSDDCQFGMLSTMRCSSAVETGRCGSTVLLHAVTARFVLICRVAQLIICVGTEGSGADVLPTAGSCHVTLIPLLPGLLEVNKLRLNMLATRLPSMGVRTWNSASSRYPDGM